MVCRHVHGLKVGLMLLALICAGPAFAWGQEGHSIVAEIAQRRLNARAVGEVERLLGRGHSLASVGSWADDVRSARPETYNLHFVDIPVAQSSYDADKHCHASAQGDCVVAELDRLKKALACAPTEDLKRDALRFAVHFVGDVHQPMHTVDEARGGNDIKVEFEVGGLTCTGKCVPRKVSTNLHAIWDTNLISQTKWNWGAYVDRLETDWLPGKEDRAGGTPLDWALQTHTAAQTVWKLTPPDLRITDSYFVQVLPIVDQQLALGGIRLARFLNEGFAPVQCKP